MQRSPAQACMPFYLISIYICIKRITSPSLRAVLFDQYLYLYQKDHLVVVSKGSPSCCIKTITQLLYQRITQLLYQKDYLVVVSKGSPSCCIKRINQFLYQRITSPSLRAAFFDQNSCLHQKDLVVVLANHLVIMCKQACVCDGTQLDPKHLLCIIKPQITCLSCASRRA